MQNYRRSGLLRFQIFLAIVILTVVAWRFYGRINRQDMDTLVSARGKRAEAPRPSSLVLNWPVDQKATPPRPVDTGVVICEPIANGADASQAAFGAGCARWLQIAVGGQGELAQTPTWSAIDRARTEIGPRDLRLTLEETRALAQKTGATHCVVGQIRGTVNEGALLVAVVDTAGKKHVGQPVTISGSRAAITRQLPQLARQIASRLGVTSASFPATVECEPGDLVFMGGVPWLPTRDLPAADKTRLTELAHKSPLAGLLALSCSDLRETARCERIAHDIVAAAPNNTAVFGGLAYLYYHGCVTESKSLDALRASYPGNYQLAAAHMMRVRGSDPAQERVAAAALVQAAPKNPDAWLSAGYTVGAASDQLRRGRYSGQLSISESSSLNQIYGEWLTHLKRATELDPEYAHAWARLATAATFAGDYGLADRALQTALRLNPGEKDALEWGLQMYQPKWGGDPAKLIDVANRAANAWHWDSRVYGIAREIEAGGQAMEARHLRSEALKQERQTAALRPDDYTAQLQYAYGLKHNERFAEAEAKFRELLKRFPHDSELDGGFHEALGDCLIEQAKRPEAIAEYQQASRMYPRSASILRELGYAYRQNREPQKAIEALKAADDIDGGNGNAWGLLGDAFLDARKMDDAVVAYKKAIELDPSQAICWRNLSIALGQTGKYAEGIRAAQRSAAMNDTDFETHMSLAYLYGVTHKAEQSADESRKVLRAHPDIALAHSNLGDALNDLHKRPEARQEWETALRLDPNGVAGKNARDMLAKNP